MGPKLILTTKILAFLILAGALYLIIVEAELYGMFDKLHAMLK